MIKVLVYEIRGIGDREGLFFFERKIFSKDFKLDKNTTLNPIKQTIDELKTHPSVVGMDIYISEVKYRNLKVGTILIENGSIIVDGVKREISPHLNQKESKVSTGSSITINSYCDIAIDGSHSISSPDEDSISIVVSLTP